MRKPYVILIGSASGIGKSTIAEELAKKLNIKHLRRQIGRASCRERV